MSLLCYPSRKHLLLAETVPMWEKHETVTFDDSPTSTKEGMRTARYFDCCNLVKSWKRTTKPDWLFEESWKCKVTEVAFEMCYLIEKRECKLYEKRQKLAWIQLARAN